MKRTLTAEQYKALQDLMQDLDSCEDVGAGDTKEAYWISGNVRRSDVMALRAFLGLEN